ncbi:CRISPR-associated protein Cmr6 [Marinitoga sp. 1137]|nr:CRISPR-associated protein Cmr6 [Marinitoga sp. 1137]
MYYDKFVYHEANPEDLKKIKDDYKDILINLDKNIIKKNIEIIKNIRIQMINKIKKHYNVKTYIVKNKTPFLIGAGIPSIDEIGFYWSRNYGLPIIPGTSIKGAFRKYIESNNDLKSIIDVVFGNAEKKGYIDFLDAIPINTIKLNIDYQTPHFQEYYMNNQPPNDVYNPIPLNYLNVSNGTFRIDLLISADSNEVINIINIHFKYFLEYFGIGAKTSMGYGRFKIQELSNFDRR